MKARPGVVAGMLAGADSIDDLRARSVSRLHATRLTRQPPLHAARDADRTPYVRWLAPAPESHTDPKSSRNAPLDSDPSPGGRTARIADWSHRSYGSAPGGVRVFTDASCHAY